MRQNRHLCAYVIRNAVAAEPEKEAMCGQFAPLGRPHRPDFGSRSPAGQLFIVDELLPENTPTKEFVKKIEGREEGYHLVTKPRASYYDPAGKSTNVQTSESEFLVLRRAGLRPLARSSSVRDCCVRIMDALADPEQPLIVAERCAGLIRALSQVNTAGDLRHQSRGVFAPAGRAALSLYQPAQPALRHVDLDRDL